MAKVRGSCTLRLLAVLGLGGWSGLCGCLSIIETLSNSGVVIVGERERRDGCPKSDFNHSPIWKTRMLIDHKDALEFQIVE